MKSKKIKKNDNKNRRGKEKKKAVVFSGLPL